MDSVLLSTAYLPPLSYFSSIFSNDIIVLEKFEHFVKQSYRNRCEILTANGKLALSIPVLKQSDKELISEKRISYAEDWQKQHWRTITSAYKNSPYFEYFEDEFRPYYENQYEFLFEFNTSLLQTVLNVLRLKREIRFTDHYQTDTGFISDKRNLSEIRQPFFNGQSYYQIFSPKSGFVNNLSCIDAVFNIGLETLHLKNA
ncbi:MAG: WbqC-like family protein [Bacteroidota bacterium]|jgi:hypothetical protein|nr:WbqC-like family protein [Bacteroidota bacterium]